MKKPLAEMETVFKALADSTRLRILGLLLSGEVCVCHIHEALKVPQPKASRHLAYLRRARLVEARREGTWMHYRLAELPDVVLGTVQNTVTHALGHQPEIQKDLGRLEKLTGCCAPAPGKTTLPCCSSSASLAQA
jgi:ArsR family transcriptional regulator